MAAVRNDRRIFRLRKNCLQEFDDRELVDRFRLDRGGIIFITDLVRHDITSPTNRNKALTAEQKVILTLRFLATGKMQLCNGDDMGVSQPSISRAVTATLESLSSIRIVRQFIRFPLTANEIAQRQEKFHRIARFPGVVGAIDGTHVRILAPSNFENEYVNRHHYHSINVQVVVDADYKILDIVSKWPGSTHDARILNESGVKLLFERGHVQRQTHLLGDSGYPTRSWLLTPFLNPQNGAETNYNRAHKRTRCIVERTIGQLKRRFHVLHGEIRLSPEKACKVIQACAVLHNICKARNIPVPGGEGELDGGGEDDLVLPVIGQDGIRYRRMFAETHF